MTWSLWLANRKEDPQQQVIRVRPEDARVHPTNYARGSSFVTFYHDDVIKWKHFPHYWPFVRGIHRSPVNSPQKGQWRGALKFSLICARINGWVNNREAGDPRRHQAHCDVIVMSWFATCQVYPQPTGLVRITGTVAIGHLSTSEATPKNMSK